MEIEENHRKEQQKGAERKSQLKCDFSDAKETRAAPLPVIGLALFPKNLSSALHLLLPCPPSPSAELSSLMLLFPGFFGAWQSRRQSVGGYSSMWPAFTGID